MVSIKQDKSVRRRERNRKLRVHSNKWKLTKIRKYLSNTTSFIMIKVATCFDPIGSSSGLHYEPVTKKQRTFLR